MVSEDEYIEDNIEEQEASETANNNIIPENIIEYNKWQNDPAYREQFNMLNKDSVLSNLTPDDVERVKAKFDLARQCESMGMDEACQYFMYLNATTLNVNCSKDGFVRKQQNTMTQEKKMDITRQKPKRGVGKLW